jgi:hypothetical protein
MRNAVDKSSFLNWNNGLTMKLMKIQKILKRIYVIDIDPFRNPFSNDSLLLFGNNAKAEPINEIILAQSKRCLEPEEEQITYQIEGIEREIKQLEDRIKELEKKFGTAGGEEEIISIVCALYSCISLNL